MTFRLLLAAVVLATVSGCSGRQALISRQQAELDSTYSVNLDLRSELETVRDSLHFLKDVDSGQYYRDRRLLVQHIQELRYDVGVCIDGGLTVETLLADDLFEPASARLTDDGRQVLKVFADTLVTAFAGRRIRVEGHSDSTPIGPTLSETFPSNWELSADRAAAVVRHLVEVAGLPAGDIELAAFGDARPVSRNDVEEGRRRNRRIRVAVMPR